MNEKIEELLTAVVAQNAKLIEQNQEFLAFFQTRDARVAERIALECEELEQRNKERSEDTAQFEHVLSTLGIGRGDLHLIAVLQKLGVYDSAKELRERLKATGKLPAKTE